MIVGLDILTLIKRGYNYSHIWFIDFIAIIDAIIGSTQFCTACTIFDSIPGNLK